MTFSITLIISFISFKRNATSVVTTEARVSFLIFPECYRTQTYD